jgi:ATP-dependent DNA helicase PIF1
VITGFGNTDLHKTSESKGKGKGDQNYFSTPILSGEHAEMRKGNIRTFMDRADDEGVAHRPISKSCELDYVEPYSFLSRTQIALVAGWAMTVLKSQGMALNRVVVNLSKSFEEGQLYVALSWAQSLQGLNAEGLGYQLRRNEQVRQLLCEKFGIR